MVAVVLALLTSVLLAPPASASTCPIDITSYRVSDQVITSSTCRMVSVSLTTKTQKDYTESWIDGLGTYTIGPADVMAGYSKREYGYNHTDYRSYTDGTTKSFYVRAPSKVSLSSRRKGRTVTLTAKATGLNLDWDQYRAYNPSSATLQVKAGKTWKTVREVKLSKGRVTVKVTSSAEKQYRFTFPKTSTRPGATSNVVTR